MAKRHKKKNRKTKRSRFWSRYKWSRNRLRRRRFCNWRLLWRTYPGRSFWWTRVILWTFQKYDSLVYLKHTLLINKQKIFWGCYQHRKSENYLRESCIFTFTYSFQIFIFLKDEVNNQLVPANLKDKRIISLLRRWYSITCFYLVEWVI